MNAIVTQDQPRLPALQSGGTVKAIVPQDFEGAWRIATAVVKAGMAPQGLDTAEKAMVAIMHGLEVGLTPMAALQSIAVVNGRPTIWGDGAIGLVRASGKCEYIREDLNGEGEAMVAVCEVKRKGEERPIVGRFSVADAKRANLWGKKGPWQQYPKRMMTMRARAFALRDGFADVLRGLGIAEEVEDIPTAASNPVPPRPPVPPVTPSATVITHEAEVPDTGAVVEDAQVEEEQSFTETAHDPDTGEVVEETRAQAEERDPSDTLSMLEERLEKAVGALDIEEAWNDVDPVSAFTHLKDADDWIGMARKIKDRFLKNLKNAKGGK